MKDQRCHLRWWDLLPRYHWDKSVSTSKNTLQCSFRSHRKEIADRIENPLEEGTPLFQRVFERVLS